MPIWLFRFPLVTVENAPSPIVPPREALVRIARTTKNGRAEAEVELAMEAKVQAMNDPESPKGVAGVKRKPKKRYEFIRDWSFHD